MSKLKTKLSKMFFNLAEKMDGEFVKDQTTVPMAQSHFLDQPQIIMYDQYHVEKIHAQHQLSRDTLMFSKNYDMDEYVSNSIVRGVSEELMKLYGDRIKTEDIPEGRIYSLDVYVCKPTKKETI